MGIKMELEFLQLFLVNMKENGKIIIKKVLENYV